MIFKDNQQLAERCAYWQKVLRLQDWKVRAEIARSMDFNDERDCDGLCTAQRSRMRAMIQIISPLDYPKDGLFGQDMEVTLVHELLHLHAAGLGLEDGSIEQWTVEKMINQLSEALVELDRRVDGE